MNRVDEEPAFDALDWIIGCMVALSYFIAVYGGAVALAFVLRLFTHLL